MPMIDPPTMRAVPLKRFYLPFVVRDVCLPCQRPVMRDLATDEGYLSYPVLNRPFIVGVSCEECGRTWSVFVILSLSLTTLGSGEAGEGESLAFGPLAVTVSDTGTDVSVNGEPVDAKALAEFADALAMATKRVLAMRERIEEDERIVREWDDLVMRHRHVTLLSPPDAPLRSRSALARTADGMPVLLLVDPWDADVQVLPARAWREVGPGPEVVGRVYGGTKFHTRESHKKARPINRVIEWRLVGVDDAQPVT